ncbi:MAG TPA: glycerophosphodiester phosphodiesterase family protein [Thermoanaerobaculia bacterium]|nr:glycerophosphodiester phosphodiesterase family protein [Thermoanaerobaculia bacterium]
MGARYYHRPDGPSRVIRMRHALPLATTLVLAALVTPPPTTEHEPTPLVIAHRGASGYLPEHTLEAYAMAFAQGADYIEPDLVLTRDRRFVCLHDIHLEATTDVEQRFPDRRRADGRWYAADFTLDEIRALRAHERLAGRFPRDRGSFGVPTFEEMIDLVQGLERTTGRRVGIYPELKAPAWHREQGLLMEEAFLALVRERGYRGPEARIFVQSFEPDALRRLRDAGSRLPQVLLLGDDEETASWLTDQGLAAARRFADGVGPHKGLLLEDPTLVGRAHTAGLVVHPYTFRADDVGPGFASFEAELERYLGELGVDGVFTDFPDRVVGFLGR